MTEKLVLSRGGMLARLEELGGEGLTVCLAPGTSEEAVDAHINQIPADAATKEQLSKACGKSANGSFIFWGKACRCLVVPPFPVGETAVLPGLDAQPLHDMLTPDRLIGFILVRLGAFAVGVSKGEELLSSKVGTGNIHGRHRQGGSSAHRFERHRDKQIEYFITRLCGHARQHIEPFVRELDYLVFGGAWTTVETVQKQCDFIARLQTPQLPPLLDIPDPRLPVLKKAVKRAWSSTVYEFPPD